MVPDFVFVALELFHCFLKLVRNVQLVGVEQQQNQVAALREPLANILELVTRQGKGKGGRQKTTENLKYTGTYIRVRQAAQV